MQQHDLQTQLEFTQAKYNDLVSKVKELLSAQQALKRSNGNQRYKPAVWQAERKLTELINPKISQATIEWMAK